MTSTSFYTALFLIISLIIPDGAWAQGDNKKRDEVIRALTDEITRNSNELKAGDKDPGPFFIAYRVSENKTANVTATLGAIINSNISYPNNWYTRVLVGSYEFNDENYSGNSRNNRQGMPYGELPQDLDYNGIRRLFWLSTNEIYLAALSTYKNKQLLFERNKVDTSQLLPDYSRAPTERYIKNYYHPETDLQKLEKLARDLSAVFLEYPSFEDSKVHIGQTTSNHWLVNSEGTQVFFPNSFCQLAIYFSTNFSHSYNNMEGLNYIAENVEDLPDIEQIKDHIRSLANKTLADTASFLLDEDYEGPVLVTGSPVADLFANSFFRGKNSLKASRPSVRAKSDLTIDLKNDPDNEDTLKTGDIIYPFDITITSTPFETEFQGKQLLGSYQIDAEGVVPSRELVLVENGRFITQINNRTPTKHVKSSNGHVPWGLFGSGTLGPGVIRFDLPSDKTIELLKNEAVKVGKEEGLDYVLWIRPSLTASEKTETVKISTTSGKETIIKTAKINGFDYEELCSFSGATGQMTATNLRQGQYVRSFILPEGILLNNASISKGHVPREDDNSPIVRNPLLDPDLNNKD